MYFEVRILFLAYVCLGLPSSSLRSSGNGRLKYSCLGPTPSPSSSLSPWVVPSCGSASDPADAPFFSSDVLRACFFAPSARRFKPLLLTVNFRVAHLVLLVGAGASGAPTSAVSSPSGSSLGGGILEMEGEDRRAEPDQPSLVARLDCEIRGIYIEALSQS